MGTDTNNDSDSLEVTGDSDDSDDDDDSDSMSATGDSDDSDDDDSDDDTSGDSDDTNSGDSDDDTDSGDSDDDSTDSTSGDSDTESGDSDDDSSDSGSSTATTASVTSYCAQLASSECSNAYANDGTAICAVNAVSQSCYAVVASSGMYGSGNYDDGYTAAAAEMEKDTAKLNTIVGVLGAIVALLVLTFVGGGYFFWKKQQEHQVQMGTVDEDMATPHSMMETDGDAMLMDEEM